MRQRRHSRWLLAALVLALPLGLGASCNELPPLHEHVLNRVGYGPNPWSLGRIRALGTVAYIREQLGPSTLDDSGLEAEIAARWPVTTWTLAKVRTTYHEYNTANPALLPGNVRLFMSYARMLRNVHSKRQLEQVLVDFWSNHFNVDARTETGRWGVVTYEREAIRPHVLGRFRDMLGAVAAHPSMLDYLDNAQNFIPGYVRGTSTFGPNENYARELLELHTVGVDAGYTLQDVQEVARAFTGWTIDFYRPNGTFNFFASSFVYEDAGHDKGSKSVMGSLFIPAGGGRDDGERVLDFLARHPATARFIAYKLAQRFIADDPPPALVDRAAATFLATDGDLREVTRAILLSGELKTDPALRRNKVKRPQHYVASVARALGVVDNGQFASHAAYESLRMGEEIYSAAPPTGYPEESAFWVGEGPFLGRLNVAQWAANGLHGSAPVAASTTDPAALVGELVGRFLLGGVHASTAARLTDFAGVIPPSVRAQETAATLLASPEFLVH